MNPKHNKTNLKETRNKSYKTNKHKHKSKIKNCIIVSTHPRHQPTATWVNTTRYCKYSQVVLMMGENIARNM